MNKFFDDTKRGLLEAAVIEYKNTMEFIFFAKYGIPPSDAKTWIEKYNFDGVLERCNYVALHDDPEVWVDAIYEAQKFWRR